MHNLVVAILQKLLPVYVCPCGFKARGRKLAMQHLETHPSGTGKLDMATDAIIW